VLGGASHRRQLILGELVCGSPGRTPSRGRAARGRPEANHAVLGERERRRQAPPRGSRSSSSARSSMAARARSSGTASSAGHGGRRAGWSRAASSACGYEVDGELGTWTRGGQRARHADTWWTTSSAHGRKVDGELGLNASLAWTRAWPGCGPGLDTSLAWTWTWPEPLLQAFFVAAKGVWGRAPPGAVRPPAAPRRVRRPR
jgi:hypothetical protein